jgi:N-acetylglucosamine kinase-like BadF-type ATPase
VDVGGTWIRIAVSRGERRLATTVERADRELRRLAVLLRAIWRRRGFSRDDVAALVVASRALWTPRERRALALTLRGLAWRVEVISDAQAALLGAIGDGPGVLVLAGTGSIVVAHDGRGRWTRVGGFGPLVGDEGSGFWLGREWLRSLARRGALLTVLRLVHAPDTVARIAALAPGVLARARRGDRPARVIARAGQTHLAACVREAARALALKAPIHLSWAGSVLEDRWFRSGLIRAVARAGVQARWRAPAAPAVDAALRLATRLAQR